MAAVMVAATVSVTAAAMDMVMAVTAAMAPVTVVAMAVAAATPLATAALMTVMAVSATSLRRGPDVRRDLFANLYLNTVAAWQQPAVADLRQLMLVHASLQANLCGVRPDAVTSAEREILMYHPRRLSRDRRQVCRVSLTGRGTLGDRSRRGLFSAKKHLVFLEGSVQRLISDVESALPCLGVPDGNGCGARVQTEQRSKRRASVGRNRARSLRN
jgi:hypothetical protein